MAEASLSDLVAERTCGSCSLCCKLFDIDWLDRPKPAGKWCHHCQPGRGCAIWKERPRPCADFYCMWRRLAGLDESWRPDRSGFIISQARNHHQWNITVDPTRPNAWSVPPYRPVLEHIAARALENGEIILIRIGRNQLVLLPHTTIPVPPGRDMQDVVLGRGPDGNWEIQFAETARSDSGSAEGSGSNRNDRK